MSLSDSEKSSFGYTLEYTANCGHSIDPEEDVSKILGTVKGVSTELNSGHLDSQVVKLSGNENIRNEALRSWLKMELDKQPEE